MHVLGCGDCVLVHERLAPSMPAACPPQESRHWACLEIARHGRERSYHLLRSP